MYTVKQIYLVQNNIDCVHNYTYIEKKEQGISSLLITSLLVCSFPVTKFVLYFSVNVKCKSEP